MTLSTDRKRHLLRRFRGCFQHTYPKGVSVHIRDHMPDLKYKAWPPWRLPRFFPSLCSSTPSYPSPGGQSPKIATVQDYIHKHILKHVQEVLEDESKGVAHYYGLLDRGGNMAKKLFTSHKRARVAPAEERADGKLSVPAEGLLPVEWDSIVANRGMADREIKPLFYRALIQVGPCGLVLWGPRLTRGGQRSTNLLRANSSCWTPRLRSP